MRTSCERKEVVGGGARYKSVRLTNPARVPMVGVEVPRFVLRWLGRVRNEARMRRIEDLRR